MAIIRGFFRSLKLCAEARLDRFITVDHAVVAWMVEHTCHLLNARVRGSDGFTHWERVRGRAFDQRLVGILEKVVYKFPTKSPHMGKTAAWAPCGLKQCSLGY